MTKVAKIPVIDIAAEGGDQARVARDLVEAAIEHGFIYIKNTGKDIPVDAIENAFNLVYPSLHPSTETVPAHDLTFAKSKKLFATPLEEKQRCKIQQNNRGWTGMHYETLDPKNQRVSNL